MTPVAAGEVLDGEVELVRVLAPLPPGAYASWRAAELARREARRLAEKRARAAAKGKPPEGEKLTAKDRQQLTADLPASLFDALHVDTGELRRAGWSDPPGSRWVDYRRPEGSISTRPAPRRARRAPEGERTVARFALASPVLPRLTEAISVADRLHRALVKYSDGAPVFSGKDAAGDPLHGHCHALYLPEANGRDGRIAHLTLYAEMGFDGPSLDALHRLDKVWGHGGHDLQTVLLGVGTPDSFAGSNLEAGQCPLFETSDVWVSRTPFIPTRHPKATRTGQPKLDDAGLQIGSPEHDLRRLLRELGRDLPEPLRVEPLLGTYLGGKAVRWSAFRTIREEGGGRRATAVGYGFRITFPHPVRGPLAVGYGAHFGLGVFVPPLERFRVVEA